MKYFHLGEEILEVLISKFIDFYNEYQKEPITIILNSAGGIVSYSDFLVDLINNNAKKITITNLGCYSAAFQLFYKATCKKKMVDGTIGMLHLSYVKDVQISSLNKPVLKEDIIHIKNLSRYQDVAFAEQFMNKSEIARFKKCEDVYFSFERMKEIFPDAEII